MSYGLEKSFKDYSVVVAHIKELLHDFNLPMIPVYVEGYTKPYEGRCYIKDNRVVRYKNCKFEWVMDYVYNQEVPNLTKKLIINSSDYDQYTHDYLGNYLRFIRDYYRYDLMSMYNCFNRNQPSRINHSLKLDDGTSYTINTDDDDYIYYIVPVKFNQDYTVALDAQCEYDMCCILYTNKFINKTPDELIKASYKNVHGSQFRKPFIYRTEFKYHGFDIAESNWDKEKNLCLLIKLPKRVNSTITILEGNWIECANVVDNTFVTNVRYLIENNEYPYVYFSKNSLLSWNDTKSRPFSQRLVEYLYNNIIGELEEIDENVANIQDKLFNTDGYLGYAGIWNDSIRYHVYNHMLDQDKTKGSNARWGNFITSSGVKLERKPKRFIDLYNDVIGYVDKDTESMVERISEVSA